jgi:hypothetical protein
MIFEKVSGKTMSERMTVSVLMYLQFLHCSFYGFLDSAFGRVMASDYAVVTGR